jgi:hypothetical protein
VIEIDGHKREVECYNESDYRYCDDDSENYLHVNVAVSIDSKFKTFPFFFEEIVSISFFSHYTAP